MDKIIIIGGKGSAVVIGEQIYDRQKKMNDVEFLGYAFDDESLNGHVNSFPILSETKNVMKKYGDYKDVKFIYQLYRPDLMRERIDLLNSLNIPNEKFYTFIHQNATVAVSAKIGLGTVVLANSVINANAKIGNHCTIQSASLIGHDTTLGDYNFVAAHSVIGSSSTFGNGNFLGLNSTYNNYLEVGNYNFIGMSSNVVKNISSNKKMYGNPAKEFSKKIKPL